MSVGNDSLGDPRFANLDAAGLVELCNSLADYGEAGGLSRELMLQVGSFAEARFAEELEVLLAVARMYLLGGETARARATLVRAGKRWPEEARVRPLLAHALKLLDDTRSVEEVLRETRTNTRPSAAPPPGAAARRPSAPPPERVAPVRVAPAPKAKDTPDTLPMTEAARIRAIAESRGDGPRPKRASHPPAAPLPPTPPSGMPIVPRAPAMPRGVGDAMSTRGSRSPVAMGPQAAPNPGPAKPAPIARSAPGRAATARAPMTDAMLRAQVEIRTEVARRAVARESEPPPPEPPLTPSSLRSGGGGPPRNTRIRLLEPDDERRLLDPYELIGELASGGMATVFLGRLAGAGGFQRLVAIKRLHPHLEREEQFVKMFLDEARLAAGIHHPHVVPILEVGMSDAGYYLVMEFIEGDTLAGLIVRSLQRGKPMPPNVAVRIVLDSLVGLHAAHQLTDGDGHYLGLVHRDCTPQNILVGIDGSARITDFGVARAASRLAITRPQQVKGKVAYLSPEQAHALELDRRSDVFTMGIVLWEALAGRPLFQADTEAATLSRLLAGQIPSLHGFAPEVPGALDEVCRRALAHDRNRRYRTAAEMADALERAAGVEGFGGVASPRELGRFVEQVMGAEIAAQRDAVRNWLTLTDGSPMSRGPRPASVRAPASPRSSVPPPSPPPAPPPPEDAPDTPPPRAEKHPRLSSVPPPPEVEVAKESPPPPVAKKQQEEAPAVETTEEPAADEAAGEEPAEEPGELAEHDAEPPPEGLGDRVRAWIVRLGNMKLSTRNGTLLVIVIVLIAIAPLAYKAVKRRAAPAAPAATASARGPKRAPPKPTAKPTAAWDEGDWPLPDGGAPTPDE